MRVYAPGSVSLVTDHAFRPDPETYHQVLRAALRSWAELSIAMVGRPMANAVRTAIPQYM